MRKHNLDKLIVVEVCDASRNDWREYKKQIKFLGIVLRREGIYSSITSEYISLHAPKDNKIINNELILNPHCILYFENGFKKIIYFDTYLEAQQYQKDIIKEGNFI